MCSINSCDIECRWFYLYGVSNGICETTIGRYLQYSLSPKCWTNLEEFVYNNALASDVVLNFTHGGIQLIFRSVVLVHVIKSKTPSVSLKLLIVSF